METRKSAQAEIQINDRSGLVWRNDETRSRFLLGKRRYEGKNVRNYMGGKNSRQDAEDDRVVENVNAFALKDGKDEKTVHGWGTSSMRSTVHVGIVPGSCFCNRCKYKWQSSEEQDDLD